MDGGEEDLITYSEEYTIVNHI